MPGEVSNEYKDTDCSFARMSQSSQSGRSHVPDPPLEKSLAPRKVTTTSSTAGGAASSDWQPPKYRRLLFRKTSATAYNIAQCLRRMFTLCWHVPFEKSVEIVVLGQVYYGSEISQFYEDVYSRIYLSYRKGFAPLKHTKPLEIRSDTGWGCTIRTGQMLIAEGLLRHTVSRAFKFSEMTEGDKVKIEGLQRLFYDDLSPESPFSIHTLTSTAFRQYGKKPGEWYNPSMVAHVLYRAMLNASHNAKVAELANVLIYVARDNCIFVADLLERCGAGDSSGASWRAPIVLVPVRLGLDRVNPTYFYCIQRFLENRYSIGFVGGRESSSYYFIGFQKDELIYLDPHYLQNSDSRDNESYHTRQVKKMRFKDLKPSCLLGFYCKSKDELRDFLSSIQVDTQAVEHRTHKQFHLVEVHDESATKFESRTTLTVRRSMGSLEVLSLFEETDRQASIKT